MDNKTTVWYVVAGLAVLAVLAAVGVWVLRTPATPAPSNPPAVSIATFDDCARAGYPVMESSPRQCRTPDGKVYVENTTNPTPGAAVATGGCYIGGCSSEVCSDQPGAVSSCIYNTAYACYQGATCARQAGGVCGWTRTPELTSCLSAAATAGPNSK